MRSRVPSWAVPMSRLAGQCATGIASLSLNLRRRVSSEEIDAWAARTRIFFVLALGRSGSMFLAHLLGQAPSACVCHEPVRMDFLAYAAAFHHPDLAVRYLRRFRQKEMYLRTRDKTLKVYGEVNSVLRRHAYALGQVFPGSTRLHLVRDGRDVVRSMMSRRTLSRWDPVTALIRPHRDDPWAEAWPRMDRFERLCWYWTTENRFLRRALDRTVRLEAALSDYDYFARHLLVPLGLTIPRDAWLGARQRPKNITDRYRIPHWSDWNRERKEVFGRICGDEMRENGYDLNWG